MLVTTRDIGLRCRYFIHESICAYRPCRLLLGLQKASDNGIDLSFSINCYSLVSIVVLVYSGRRFDSSCDCDELFIFVAMSVVESCNSQGSVKMAAQGTANYVYFFDQQLGLGASGNVYLGRHKVLCQFILLSVLLIFI